MKTLRFSAVLVLLMLTRCASIDLESEFLHDNELQVRILEQTSDAGWSSPGGQKSQQGGALPTNSTHKKQTPSTPV